MEVLAQSGTWTVYRKKPGHGHSLHRDVCPCSQGHDDECQDRERHAGIGAYAQDLAEKKHTQYVHQCDGSGAKRAIDLPMGTLARM